MTSAGREERLVDAPVTTPVEQRDDPQGRSRSEQRLPLIGRGMLDHPRDQEPGLPKRGRLTLSRGSGDRDPRQNGASFMRPVFAQGLWRRHEQGRSACGQQYGATRALRILLKRDGSLPRVSFLSSNMYGLHHVLLAGRGRWRGGLLERL